MPSRFSSQFNTNIFLSVSHENKRNSDNTISVVFQSRIHTYRLSICFFFRRWNLVEKIPWGRNILLFLWWERSHYRYWQAQSEFATISADDLARSHRALGDTDHFSLPVVQPYCEDKSSFIARGVIYDSTDIALHSTAWLQHPQPEKCPQSSDTRGSGQRIVSLHSRLCSEEGESTGLVEALVVCGRCFGRRMEGDKLNAPQLWRWRSSWPRFLGLPLMRWVIICATKRTSKD